MYIQHKILSVQVAETSVCLTIGNDPSMPLLRLWGAVTGSPCSEEMGSDCKGERETSRSLPPSHSIVLQLHCKAEVDPSWLP